MDIQMFCDYGKRVIENCSRVIIGKEETIRQVLVSFLCGGHVLLEDVPGTGKTMLLRSFAKTIGGEFKRVQFTPDLLPSDLTGIHFYNQKTGEFQFRPGPLFAGVVLADEINRATPRTQSALLEAMEERQITVDGTTFPMATPFMVMATQNPIESHGTFPLPDAQTDRFFMRLRLGYMTREQELSVMARVSTLVLVEDLKQVVTAEETAACMEQFHQVRVSEDVANYMLDIVDRTRKDSAMLTGVSTRGAMALYKASQVTALFNGRDYVIPEDVKYVAPHVLAHRISADGTKLIGQILESVPVPMEQLA